MREEEFVLIRVDMLPEAVKKTLDAKKLIESGQVKTVQDAVEQVNLSRSSFYKYKDSVYLFNKLAQERIVTISMVLEHTSGVLSNVLGSLAKSGANVLTIHQTIPLQGEASVSMSVETIQLHQELDEMVDYLRSLPGVRRAVVIGSGK